MTGCTIYQRLYICMADRPAGCGDGVGSVGEVQLVAQLERLAHRCDDILSETSTALEHLTGAAVDVLRHVRHKVHGVLGKSIECSVQADIKTWCGLSYVVKEGEEGEGQLLSSAW